uniref:Uncharacterized protein n=1 Tax=Rhizophora mucronata TaxID=61149 RepID=A0A2P2PPH8_RHIMU
MGSKRNLGTKKASTTRIAEWAVEASPEYSSAASSASSKAFTTRRTGSLSIIEDFTSNFLDWDWNWRWSRRRWRASSSAP